VFREFHDLFEATFNDIVEDNDNPDGQKNNAPDRNSAVAHMRPNATATAEHARFKECPRRPLRTTGRTISASLS
jgi:hypothetical protein